MFHASTLSIPLLLVSSFLTATTSAFNANADTNVAVYWGQGPDQERLADYCRDSNIDIFNLAFVNIFPDQGTGGFPGDNFGNACQIGVYIHDGIQTELLNDCPDIGPDIITCQEQYGKKILLSIGGALPGNGYLDSDSSATAFADFLWGAFGPVMATWTANSMPRPFGNAVIDGFDFDIESTGVTAAQESFGWATMVNHLHDELFPLDNSKDYYISGAPQCVLPDAHLSDAIANSWFDFIFVQFYNTPYCSARAGVDKLDGVSEGDWDISLSEWFAAPSKNPNSKIFIGLPASPDAAGSPSFYLQPSEVQTLVNFYQPKFPARFGGISLWDVTRSAATPIDGAPYANVVKNILVSSIGSSSSKGEIGNGTQTTSSAAVSIPATLTVATPLASVAIFVTTHAATSSSRNFQSAASMTTLYTATSSSPSAAPTLSSCQPSAIPCQNPGTLVCMDTMHFGICDINYCALPQMVAAGTTCTNGAIAKSKRDINAFVKVSAASHLDAAIIGRSPNPSEIGTFTAPNSPTRKRHINRRDTVADRTRRLARRGQIPRL